MPVGDTFVPRLGPVAGERFAAIDDPDTDLDRPRPGPDTPIDELRFVAVDCETTAARARCSSSTAPTPSTRG
ncbi:MAG: hypothetical protein ABSA40_07075 [Candidatus Dormibacteria bacterium]